MNGLNQQSEARGTGGGLDQLVYLEREFNANFMVNRAIDFIDDTKVSNPNQPFFMNVWLDETHTPHDPPAALRSQVQQPLSRPAYRNPRLPCRARTHRSANRSAHQSH